MALRGMHLEPLPHGPPADENAGPLSADRKVRSDPMTSNSEGSWHKDPQFGLPPRGTYSADIRYWPQPEPRSFSRPDT